MFNKAEHVKNENGGGRASSVCPRCYSEGNCRDGRRRTKNGLVQRHRCDECGYRFSGALIFSSSSEIDGERRVCVTGSGAKNLIVANEENLATGDITRVNSIIQEFDWWMKKQAMTEDTRAGYCRSIKQLFNAKVDLENPDSVKEYLASRETEMCSNGRNRNIVHAYSKYLEMNNRTWDKPRYKRERKVQFLPSEHLLDLIIAAVPNKYGPFCQLLKETGMRRKEAWMLKWTDIDFAKKVVDINPVKNSDARQLPISDKIIAMLNLLPRDSDHIFKKGLLDNFGEGFRKHRVKIAKRLDEPDIVKCSFKTFRTYYGTDIYYRWKDPLEVKYRLGHRSLKSTEYYMQRVKFRPVEYVSKLAKTTEEIIELAEAGYEFFSDTPEGQRVFRKQK